MNINITTICNLRCPYCFAVDLWKAAGKRPSDREISIANLHKVIRFLKRSKIWEFRMIGGEPTLHSRFERIYTEVADNGFRVELFSNGVINGRKVDFLARQDSLDAIVINIQQLEMYRPAQRRQLMYTLERLGSRVSLGYVIYRTDFDLRFLIPIMAKYPVRRGVKLSFAAPTLTCRNAYLPPHKHRLVIQRLVVQAGQLGKAGIKMFPDTAFMWCLFTKQQLESLRRSINFRPVNLCMPVLEVSPNLTVFRCFGTASLTDPRLKITRFKNVQEAFKYFSAREAGIKQAGLFGECLHCQIKGSLCGGGCVAEIVKSLRQPLRNFVYR